MSALGDVLFAVPLAQALADSGRVAHLAWLVEDRAAALLRMVPEIDELVVFPRRRKGRWPAHVAALRRRRDDLVLDLQGNLKSRLHLACLRAPDKWGFDLPRARDGAERALTRRLPPHPDRPHRVDANLALLTHFGLEPPRPSPRPRLAIPAAARERVGAWLAEQPGRGPFVLMHPGTSAFGAFKRWPAERYGELADTLRRRLDARVLLSGGPAEAELVEQVRAACGGRARQAPTAGLEELAALLDAVDLVVAGDSLPLHLANALATPVVGLYGPKDPRVTGPAWDRARVVRAGVHCSPCSLRRCADPICMTRLATAAVADAACALLDAAPARA